MKLNEFEDLLEEGSAGLLVIAGFRTHFEVVSRGSRDPPGCLEGVAKTERKLVKFGPKLHGMPWHAEF